MKLQYKLLIGAGIGIALYSGWKAYSLTDTVKSMQLKIKSFSIKFPKIYLTLQIFNPTVNEILIDSIVGTILYNNQEIGSIQFINKVPIAPNNYTLLKDVLVDLSPSGLLIVSKNLVMQSDDTGVIKFKGNIYYKGIGFPFDQSIKIY